MLDIYFREYKIETYIHVYKIVNAIICHILNSIDTVILKIYF